MKPRSSYFLLISLFGCNGPEDAESGHETDVHSDTPPVDTGPYDADEDGVLAADDCDDADPLVGSAQELYPDTDADGYGAADAAPTVTCPSAGMASDHSDCDDTTNAIYPGAVETWCTPTDNNCDGEYSLDQARADGVLYADGQAGADATREGGLLELCDANELVIDHAMTVRTAFATVLQYDPVVVTAPAGVVTFEDIHFGGAGPGVVDVDGLEAGGCLAILGGADVVVQGAFFDNCKEDKGGAIFASGAGIVTIRDSSFVANEGGAIVATGDLVVEDTAFELNVGDGREGGAIWSSGGLELSRVTFEGNTATLGGGALYHKGPSASLTDVDFLSNSTDGNGGGAVLAGPLNTLENVVVDGNTAVGNGGGIWSSSTMTTVSGGIFTGNSAVDGGAIALDGDGSWIGGTSDTNTASGAGGGISAVGTWTINDVTSVGDDGFSGDGLGIKPGSTVAVTDSEFVGKFLGETVEVSDSQLYASGVVVSGPSFAGIYLTSDADAQLEDCTIDGADFYGIYIISDATATVTNSVISNNDVGVQIRNVDAISFTSISSTFTGNVIDVEPLSGDPFTSVDGTFTCDDDACYE